jgi:hypothetical protein
LVCSLRERNSLLYSTMRFCFSNSSFFILSILSFALLSCTLEEKYIFYLFCMKNDLLRIKARVSGIAQIPFLCSFAVYFIQIVLYGILKRLCTRS